MKLNKSGIKTSLKHRPNYWITIAVVGLIVIGLIMLYSLGNVINYNSSTGKSGGNTYFITQIIAIILGFMGWFLISKISYKTLIKLAPALMVLALFLMILPRIPALQYNQRGFRWIKVGPLSFQPVEFLKFSLVTYFALIIQKIKVWDLKNNWQLLIRVIILVVICGGMTALIQKDLGSAMIVVTIILITYLGSKARLAFVSILVLLIVLGTILAIIVEPYRLSRVTTFIEHYNGTDNSSGSEEVTPEGYHITQAIITLGSGGLLGRGLGKSYQTYGYLPQPADDSIFVVVGEQLGLLGSLLMLSLYLALIYNGLKIATQADSLAGRALALGVVSWIAMQVIINVGAMIKLLPLTGVTLPFISYGGSSMLFTIWAIGLLQNVSKYTLPKKYFSYQRKVNSKSYVSKNVKI